MMQMKKSVQEALLHILVGVVLFVVALLFFNYRISAVKGSPMAELAGSTYPVIEIGTEHGDYNQMSAYRGEIDLSLVRNQVTVAEESGSLMLKLYSYDYDITAIQYVLFEKNPEQPLEEGTLNQLEEQEEGNCRTGTIQFESDLKDGTNYYLRLAVRLDNNTKAYFYTRLQGGSGYPLEEYFTYAKEFHQNLLSKETAEKNAGYLEPDPSMSSSSLEYVNIHSSLDQISYGAMEIREEYEPRIKVREINDTYAVLELSTVLSSEISDGIVQYYDLRETLKMRYTPERMYLLDYERTMDARYNEKCIDSSNNYIGLGIQDMNKIDYRYSDDCKRLCFVLGGQFWYYNYNSSDVTRVYSSFSENLADRRNAQDEQGIKILNMDDEGNITYLIYGYMSRGRHEGANGIEIVYFDAQANCNEELAFLETSVPYSTMKKDMEKLAYLNQKNNFYCVLDGDLHKVDLEEKTDQILRSGLVDESLTASKDQSIIAIEESQDVCDNQKIELIQLENGKKQEFTCEKDKRIRAVGFLANDFIYGEAQATDVSRTESGVVTFPMLCLHIVDTEGEEVKNYRKTGRYIVDTEVNGSVLEMEFARKNGKKFSHVNNRDYIRYKEEETDEISLTSKVSSIFGEQIYFKFPEYIYIQVEPDLVLSKMLTSEDNLSLNLEKSGEQVKRYYTYADGQEQGIFSNLPEAVKYADEIRGNVIDNQENVLWQCAFEDYDIVAGMDQVTKVSSDSQSLAGCISMIAGVNGKSVRPSEVDGDSKYPAALMEEYCEVNPLNLTGCSTDEVLYYISQGSPVLAKYSKSRYVILMSYNSTKIRYLDPVTGKSTAVGREELSDTLKKAGNVFYSYLTQ